MYYTLLWLVRRAGGRDNRIRKSTDVACEVLAMTCGTITDLRASTMGLAHERHEQKQNNMEQSEELKSWYNYINTFGPGTIKMAVRPKNGDTFSTPDRSGNRSAAEIAAESRIRRTGRERRRSTSKKKIPSTNIPLIC